MNGTTRLTSKVVQMTLFLLTLMINPSHPPTLTNDYDNDGNQIDADLTENEGVEDAVVPNDENNDEDSLAPDIDPPPKQYYGN